MNYNLGGGGLKRGDWLRCKTVRKWQRVDDNPEEITQLKQQTHDLQVEIAVKKKYWIVKGRKK